MFRGFLGGMRRLSLAGWIGSAWGIGGVLALLGFAVYRLTPVAVASLDSDLEALHVAGYVASILFMGYSEGYRAFQRAFSPRVVARGMFLAENPRPLFVAFAPAFCMAYFHATPRRQLASWILSGGIVGLVLLVGRVPQPWRGIIDVGVVIALVWGMLAILFFWAAALAGKSLPVGPEVPELGPKPEGLPSASTG